MALADEIAIVMQGRNSAANRHRSWRVDAGRDLFGQWTVRVSFGRIGCAGRTIAHAFASEDEARTFVKNGIRRRRGAIRRCGVVYEIIEASPAALPLLTIAGLCHSP